ncbi:sarcosine oxidase subunit gamma [Sagittula sp. SSi028]|uniref:sarcosine oxidase subunit gamma n=1 Tax=Sagittula sp. SSi028 TaxID=3400636 RepID=UPI003AF5FA4B
MTDLSPLIPQTALGTVVPREARIGSVILAEDATLGLASIALRAGYPAPTPFGLTLPDVSGVSANARAGAFWMGRGQWMLELPGQAEADVVAQVVPQAPGCAVTEQTDGFVTLNLSASAAQRLAQLLEKLVNVAVEDLAPGRVVRTGLDHMTVFVIRRSATELTVLGMRSFANALWHALERAIRNSEGST